MLKHIQVKISIILILITILFSSNIKATPSVTGLYFSNELQIGDNFSWSVIENTKNDQDINTGIFKIGAKIEVEIIDNPGTYNHYILFADSELSKIFRMKIDNSTYSSIFVIDFIIPIIFEYSDGSIGNYFDVKVDEEVQEDYSKIRTTRDITDGLYTDKIQIFNKDDTDSLILETQFQVTTGLLRFLSIQSEVLQLRIVGNYDAEGESTTEKNTTDDSSFSLIFPAIAFSVVLLIIVNYRKSTY